MVRAWANSTLNVLWCGSYAHHAGRRGIRGDRFRALAIWRFSIRGRIRRGRCGGGRTGLKQTEGLGSPTCTARVCWNFTRGDSRQFADSLAGDAGARAVGPGRRSSDRRAHLEPAGEARATYLVSFAGRELGLERNRHRFVSGLCGLASIVLGLVYSEQEMQLPGEATILLAVIVTVLLSIFAHGLARRLASDFTNARSRHSMPPQRSSYVGNTCGDKIQPIRRIGAVLLPATGAGKLSYDRSCKIKPLTTKLGGNWPREPQRRDKLSG